MDELLAAATRKSYREIKKLLAERYPKADVPTKVRALPRHHASAPNDTSDLQLAPCVQLSARTVSSSATRAEEDEVASELGKTAEAPAKPAKVEPLGVKRYSLQLTMSQQMHDKLRHAQALMSHQIPSGDVASVLERALDALIAKLEKAKFAATGRPRATKADTSANPRHIPAHVRRAVRERVGCQCTFVSEAGERCPERRFLEFDHVDPVACGGEATTLRRRGRFHRHAWPGFTGWSTHFGSGLLRSPSG